MKGRDNRHIMVTNTIKTHILIGKSTKKTDKPRSIKQVVSDTCASKWNRKAESLRTSKLRFLFTYLYIQ